MSFFNPLDVTYQKIWPEYSLIFPVCAVGNVGQLACDLIISTLLGRQECQLVGRIYSPAFMSVVGPNAFHFQGPITSSMEVYESKKHKLIVVQQRTSIFKELRKVFIDELVQWIKQSKFEKVYVLSSSQIECNTDFSVIGHQNSIRTITTSVFEEDNELKALNLKRVTKKEENTLVSESTYLPGSGITKRLMKAFEKSFIPAFALVTFCSEGVNTPECYAMVQVLDRIIKLNEKQGYAQDAWTEPPSWIESSLHDSYVF